MRSYTNIKQSKKLAEILPLESADMWYHGHYSPWESERKYDNEPCPFHSTLPNWDKPCWSLAALLNYIKDKCGYFELVYLSSTFDGRANRLEDVHRLSTDVYDVYNKELVDACYELVLKLNELNLL